MADQYHVAWDLLVELRKEALENQKIRAQIVGVKITFVSVGIGLIASNQDKIPARLFMIPALAAIFFDFLIASYSFSSKRIGHYCRHHVENRIRAACDLPESLMLWYEFLGRREARRFAYLSFLGNIGLTVVALVPAVIGLFRPFHPLVSVLLLEVLVGLFAFDMWSYSIPTAFLAELEKKEKV